MKRRAFLKFLGLAPVAVAVPAMALPRAEKPMATGGFVKGKVDYRVGETPGESILIDVDMSKPSQLVIDVDALTRDLEENSKWLGDEARRIISELDRLGRA
ncbi:hypothetical protein WH297_06045 [Ochrobactrum vermis]|uniref:Twin-arginine translocation signal domain-containing protein n=1 Tax=Ochrobactrum vermis TaxID=1827297 RepID=A0ABU8PCH3_9HYPH|nr:hypothetical protein [Ochrobactrum vermis]PQZ29791.1 hypothetical protein CQZ93_06175 [Ochrobactrum vermis]